MDSRALYPSRVATEANTPNKRLLETARLVAEVNVSATGSQTIDGVSVADKDIVLLTAQSSGANNGLWRVRTSGAWRRLQVAGGMLVGVRAGNVRAGSLWMLKTADPLTLGTTAQAWALVSNSPYPAAARLLLTDSSYTLSGVSVTVDGKTPADGDLVLRATATNVGGNDGMYIVKSAGAWTRICGLDPTHVGSNGLYYPHGFLVTIWDGNSAPVVWATSVNGSATF